MLTDKSELVELNVYGAISVNDEAINNFYVVLLTHVPYTLKEDVESYENQLASGNLFCNEIYKSPRLPTYHFYVELCKRKNMRFC